MFRPEPSTVEIHVASHVVGVIYGYYTVRVAASPRPRRQPLRRPPGALGAASVSGRDERVRMSDWSRGAR